MFQALGFVVHLVPAHAKDFMKHAFDEVMAGDQLPRDLASFGSQLYTAVLADGDQAVAFQPAQSHSDSRGGYGKPLRQPCGDDLLAFAFSFENGLEIVFFGNGDHMLNRDS